jgi:hypothetical protein
MWEVNAGLIPDQIEPEHRRQWALTSAEWDGGKGLELFMARQAEARAYAAYLELLCVNGRAVNWTRIDFVWF